MIQCKPKGMFSWNFFLEGEGHQAILDFNWVGEQGHINIDGTVYDISKHGMFSGEWSLNLDGVRVATAQKSNAFTRTFEMISRDEAFLIRAKSAFGRSFVLEYSDAVVAAITPNHPFGRSATINTRDSRMDFPTIAFAFWIVVLNWRRQAGAASGAA
jgi:hypothetical protein